MSNPNNGAQVYHGDTDPLTGLIYGWIVRRRPRPPAAARRGRAALADALPHRHAPALPRAPRAPFPR